MSNVPNPPAPPSGSYTRSTSDLLKAAPGQASAYKTGTGAFSRFRTMDVDPGALPGDSGGTVRAALFEDTTVTLELGPATPGPLDSKTWTGFVVGQPLSTVTLVQIGEVFSGSITCTEGSFSLHWVKGQEIEVRQRDKSTKATCENSGTEPAGAQGVLPGVSAKGEAEAQATNIGIYCVYNQGVVTELGGVVQATAKMIEFITQANQTFANSNIDVRLVLTGSELVSYTQASNASVRAADLEALTEGSTFASIRAKRNVTGSDLIALLIHVNPPAGTSFTSGLAWTPNKATGLRSDLGFSVSALEGFDNFTFAHEVGHNFGCQHDTAQEIDPPNEALYTFAYGQRRPGVWATVMAYTQGNEVNIPNFSNPNINFQGNPTGVAGVTENWRAMNDSAAGVAAYVGGIIPTPSPSPGASPVASPSPSVAPSPSPTPSGSPSANVTVSLVAGWNGVGFQRQTISSLTGTSQVPGQAVFTGSGYSFSEFTQANLSSGAGARRGLYLFATAPTTFTYTGGSDGQGNFVNLQSGYNLCSFVTTTDIPGSQLQATVNGASQPLGNVVLPTFFELGPTGNTPVNVGSGGSLKAGKAYFVFAAQNGTRLTW